jgi:two-component system cell cycle response regulator
MRIALVDPSRTTRLIVTRLLEARGHEAIPFSDGPDALRCLKFDPGVEALITSAELPTMSGVELCWEARLLATYRRSIYVVLMSSSGDQRQLIEALDSGADDFIGKPPLAEELYARLRAAERIASMQRELVWLATTDALTGLYNRRSFFERATEVCQRANVQAPVSAIVWDSDNFKSINDTYGHHVGDEAIQTCARLVESKDALVGRLGGDEFAMVLERRSLPEAIEVAEDLRLRLAGGLIATDNGQINLTCSIGVSEAEPGDDIDQLLRRADVALYDAKIGGRNRVVGANLAMLAANDADQQRCVTRAAVR